MTAHKHAALMLQYAQDATSRGSGGRFCAENHGVL